MKNTASGVAIVLILGACAAHAADLPFAKDAPVFAPPPPPALWSGFYGGVNLGGGWAAGGQNSVLPYADPAFPIGASVYGATNLFLLPGGGNTSNNTGGVVGGAQVGYNFELRPSIVIGGEADIQGASITGGNAGNTIVAYPSPLAPGDVLVPLATGNGGNLGLPWFGTLRGRVGWLAMPTLLVYGAAGFAYGEVTAFNSSNTRTGWTAGGGLEWMFASNWSAKLEYLFMDLDSGGVTGAWGWNYGYHRHPQVNVLRLGVNYHFNSGAPAPVLARY
ncbi:MAG TPA: outer membrane beta-barrel protein [Methylocystis sp.]|nr:outer membrane beta-barrel protein [Methylocystis sp.]